MAAATEMPVAAAAAVFKTVAAAEVAEGELAHQGHLHPLRCARDFMAEVQARSTSSNIVAATFTGLRARLEPTIAHLAHRAAGPGGGRAAAAPGTQPGPGTGHLRGRASTMDTVGPGFEETVRGRASNMDTGGPGLNSDADSRQSAARQGAHAGAGDGCNQQEAVQVGRQLASQLAGLKRRAALREYST